MSYIIITGNVVDGLGFIGPFDSGNEANDYADYALPSSAEYWVTEIDTPEESNQ